MEKKGFLARLLGRKPVDGTVADAFAETPAMEPVETAPNPTPASTEPAAQDAPPPEASSAWYAAAADYLREKEARPETGVLSEVAMRHGISEKDLVRAASAKKGVDRLGEADPDLARRIAFMSDGLGLQLYRWPDHDFAGAVELARAVNEGEITLTAFTEANRKAIAEEKRRAAATVCEISASDRYQGDWHAAILRLEALLQAEPNWTKRARVTKAYATGIGVHIAYLKTMKYAMKGWRRLAAIDPELAERLKARSMGVCKFVEQWPGERFEEAVALARGVADSKVSAKEMQRQLRAVASPLPRGHHVKPENRAAVRDSRAMKARAPKGTENGGGTFGAEVALPERRPPGPKKPSSDNWVAAAREFAQRRRDEPRTSHKAIKAEIAERLGISGSYLATMAAALGGLERVRALDPAFAEALEGSGNQICYYLGRWPDELILDGIALAKDVVAGRADVIDLMKIGGTKVPLETPEARTRRLGVATARWHEAVTKAAAKRREIGDKGGILKAMAEIAESYGIEPLNFANMEYALSGWERARAVDPGLAERLKGASHEISKALSSWPEESFGEALGLAAEVLDGLRTQESFKRTLKDVLEEKRRAEERPDDYHLAAIAAVIAALGGPGQTRIASDDGDEALVLESGGVRTTVAVIRPGLDRKASEAERQSALEAAATATNRGGAPNHAAIVMPEEAGPEAMAALVAARGLKRVRIHVMRTRTVYDALPPMDF